jgi:hypothetical protein
LPARRRALYGSVVDERGGRRPADVVGVLSTGTDVATSFPLELGLCTCRFATAPLALHPRRVPAPGVAR